MELAGQLLVLALQAGGQHRTERRSRQVSSAVFSGHYNGILLYILILLLLLLYNATEVTTRKGIATEVTEAVATVAIRCYSLSDSVRVVDL